MGKSESHGLKVSCIAEEAKMKAAAAAEGTEARDRGKRGGVISARRRLVKRMMWEHIANWVRSAFSSCFCSSAACSEPVRAKKTTVGATAVLPLLGKHQCC
ncbi:hypothetical protein ACJRO7_024430 [Eucalyptus globulus]|uniref:Uncharacterized protein n=1 Tax=Eucalyptus globulus TaxID=34317 RepID=A0ABD3KEA3_EUCGL